MLETDELVGDGVLGSLLIQKFELRKRTKQHSTVSVKSVVYHVSCQTHQQSGGASVSAAAVGRQQQWRQVRQRMRMDWSRWSTAKAMRRSDGGGGIFDGSLLILKNGIFEARSTLQHEEDLDNGTMDVCTQGFKQWNRQLDSA